METIGGKIRFLRESQGMTQKQLARLVRVAPVTISKWENDVSKPKAESIKLLTETFKVNSDAFIHHKNKIEANKCRLVEVPFYSKASAAAGGGVLVLDETVETLDVPEKLISNKNDIVSIAISGDSMEPVFNDNTIVFIDQSDVDVADGKVYVFVHDGMVRMKILEVIPIGLRMKSYNVTYPPENIDIKKESVKVVGRVIAQMQKY
ncbi:MAG: XRE family transcriptional regulator [Saezia sp.]